MSKRFNRGDLVIGNSGGQKGLEGYFLDWTGKGKKRAWVSGVNSGMRYSILNPKIIGRKARHNP